MNLIKPFALLFDNIDGEEILWKLERIGRVCYKSENKITDDSAEKFVRMIIKNGHESVLEHVSLTAHIVCDRGVSHEIVRHRLASYSQESTRYVNYGGKDIEFVIPDNFTDGIAQFTEFCGQAERTYNEMLASGCTPQVARAVLPNCVKTELYMTANLREWRHFFKLRTSPAAHPDMQYVANMLLHDFKLYVPVIFDDIGGKQIESTRTNSIQH